MTTLFLGPDDSIGKALAEAPQGPLTLILSGGVWREKVVVTRPDVTMISEEGAVIEADDRHGTIRDGKYFWTGDSATFTIAAPNFDAMGITFANTFDYDSGLRYNEEHKDEPHMTLQAVALRTVYGAGRSTFRACTFLGHQDTLYLDTGDSFFDDCTVKGNLDFIFGAGAAIFQGCEIVSLGKGTITAPSTFTTSSVGFIFHDSSFLLEGPAGNNVYLARPWHPAGALNRSPMVLFVDCELGAHINPLLWTTMKSQRPDGTESVWSSQNSRFFISSMNNENIKVDYADRLIDEMLSRR